MPDPRDFFPSTPIGPQFSDSKEKNMVCVEGGYGPLDTPGGNVPLKAFQEEKKQKHDIEVAQMQSIDRDRTYDPKILSLKGFPDDLLIINDIILSDVPTTAIGIDFNDNTDVYETLRSKSPTVKPNSHQDVVLNLSLAFAPGPPQQLLHKLVAQLRRHPLCYIFNNYIRSAILGTVTASISSDVNTIFILEFGELKSTNDTVGTIVLNLTFHYFNYKPFTNHFWYNARLGGISSQLVDTEEKNAEIDTLLGYQPSSYAIDKYARQVMQDLDKTIKQAKELNQNVPINFPHLSDCWNYFARHLESLTPTIPERTSDFVGFSAKFYRYISPPGEAKTNRFGYESIFNAKDPKLSTIHPMYSAETWNKVLPGMGLDFAGPPMPGSGTSSVQGQEEFTGPSAPGTNSGGWNTNPVSLMKTNTSWLKARKEILSRGGIDPWKTSSALTQGDQLSNDLNPLGGNKKLFNYVNASKCNIMFCETLKRAGYKTPDMKREIGHGYPDAPMILQTVLNGGRWKHAINPKEVVFLRLTGKTQEEIQNIINLGIPVGLVYSKHVMIIGKINHLKYAGDRISHISAVVYDQTEKSVPDGYTVFLSFEKHGVIEIFEGIPKTDKTQYKTTPVVQRTSDVVIRQDSAAANSNPAAKKIQDRQKEKEKKSEVAMQERKIEAERSIPMETGTDSKYADMYRPTTTEELIEAGKIVAPNKVKREEWISSLAQAGWYEYQDPKIRNVFYSTVGNEIKISSSPNSDVGDTSYGKDIVCSAISATFGHRIVPIKLASHPRYTWQFLGSGNRSGSLVFTFKGIEGRYAANRIKELIRSAKENGATYQSLVPTAGSISISSYNFETEEQNTILRLLDVKDVVVTDVSENAIPGMQDVYQMVINFIVQEFQEERLEQKLMTSWESKKTIINSLISNKFIVFQDGNSGLPSYTLNNEGYRGDYRRYLPNPALFRYNANANTEAALASAGVMTGIGGRQQIFTGGTFPAWLADAITQTVSLLNEINEIMPPIDWKTSPQDNFTWKDRYKELLGSSNMLKGMIKNVAHEDTLLTNEIVEKLKEQNSFMFSNAQDAVINAALEPALSRKALEQMIAGKFPNNGGKATNAKHMAAYERFSAGINSIVRDVQKYMADPEFQKYFPGVTAGMIDSISKQLNVCYEDMDLPLVPGGTVKLPPEFYVYNDSAENTLAIQNDSNKLAALVENYRANSQNSIMHYLTKNYLAGRYVSKYLPMALYAKGIYDQYNDAENQMFDPSQSWKMLEWGTKAWDPVYFRPEDTEQQASMQKWIDTVSNGLKKQKFNRTSEDTRFIFMDNMLRLSPFLKHEENPLFGEQRGETFKLGEMDMVASIYGDNWNKVALGPNQENALVDAAASGIAIPEQTKQKMLERYGTWATQQKKTLDEAVKSGSFRQLMAAKEIIEGSTPPPIPIPVQGGVAIGSIQEVTPKAKFYAHLAKKIVEYKRAGKELGMTEIFGLAKDYLLSSLGSMVLDSSTLVDWLKTGEGLKELRDAIVKEYGGDAAGAAAGALALVTGSPYLAAGAAIGANKLVDELLDNSQEVTEKRVDQVNLYNDLSSSVNTAVQSVITSKQEGLHADVSVASVLGSRAKDISIRRAYPTFRIYFIEEDEKDSFSMNGEFVKAFDDFYSYSAIQEIRIIRSRKIAADLAIIRMTNVAGILLRKRFGETENRYDRDDKKGIGTEDSTGIYADTEKENPFWRLLLTEGVKVQIRLGFSSDPDQLETPFLGQIVEIAPSEDGKILEIMCQGYGAELDAVELGDEKESPIFYSSTEALSAAIIQDNIVHFGRHSRDTQVNPAEARHAFFGGSGSSNWWDTIKGVVNLSSPGDIYSAWATNQLYRQHFRYTFLNEPQDDNIYAPPPWIYMPDKLTWFDGACEYSPNRQTTWDIFKEHELRHPGYVSLAVPYGNSGRMTMFFGSRSQYYWANPPSTMETFLSQSATSLLISMRNWSNAFDSKSVSSDIKKLATQYPDLAKAIANGIVSVGPPVGPAREIGKIMGRYRPFVNYHYLDSFHHIIENKIRTSIDGTFNQVDFSYMSQGGINGMVPYSAKLDANLPPEDIRAYQDSFKSCVSEYMAARYAIGLFVRSLKDCYKGELIIIGDASIKPYDIAVIADAANAMTGPIEVQQVEHVFNAEHGFITIITPDMCVDGNDYLSGVALGQMAWLLPMVFAHGTEDEDYGDYNSSKSLMLPLASMRGPIQILGTHAALKLMNFTNNGCPVIATPLVYEGKPFIPVIFGPKTCSVFSTLGGRWEQWWDDLGKAWDRTDIGEDAFEMYQDWKAGFFAGAAGLPRANQSLAPSQQEPTGGGE